MDFVEAEREDGKNHTLTNNLSNKRDSDTYGSNLVDIADRERSLLEFCSDAATKSDHKNLRFANLILRIQSNNKKFESLPSEKRAKEAEKRAKEAEEKAESAEKRAESAENKAESAEKRAKEAEEKAESAEKRVESAEKLTKEAEDRAIAAEKKSDSIDARLTEFIDFYKLTHPEGRCPKKIILT